MSEIAHLAVIVPAHNCEHTIIRTLRSIDAHTLCASVVIVVDDCSTDDTSAILLAYQAMMPELKIVQLSSNRGAGSARQAGLNSAVDTEFVAFLDADDTWHPEHLQRALELLLLSPDLAAICANAVTVVDHEEPWVSIANPEVCTLSLRDLMTTSPVVQSTVVARRDALQLVGGYRESMRYAEDFDLWLRLVSLREVRWIARPHARRYLSESQLSRQRHRMIAGNWAAVAHFELWGVRHLPAEQMQEFEALVTEHSDSDMRFARADWDRSLHEDILNGAAALVYQSPRLVYWRRWLRWAWPALASLRVLYARLPVRLRVAGRTFRRKRLDDGTARGLRAAS
jgi:glycosyltransferase involved in cell wall biosynthesis